MTVIIALISLILAFVLFTAYLALGAWIVVFLINLIAHTAYSFGFWAYVGIGLLISIVVRFFR